MFSKSIPKSYWQNFNEAELSQFAKQIFNYYRTERGFPFFELTKEQRYDIFVKLQTFNAKSLLKEGDILTQNMLGLNLCNYYMPHMWSVRCQSFHSPMDAFKDDDLFLKAIYKRLSLGTNISDAGIRKALCWANGAQRVSNFRPTVAKYIYETYGHQGNVLDFSAGYGGRLCGALPSSISHYTGIDPCKATVAGLQTIIDQHKGQNKATIIESGFEETDLPTNSFDLVFSSPPYFNTEHYDIDAKQSWVRYPTKEQWRDQFLSFIINKSQQYLKAQGYFVINIANVKTYKNLEQDTVTIAQSTGLKLVKTYKMALSNLMKSGFKYEPIFVFQK